MKKRNKYFSLFMLVAMLGISSLLAQQVKERKGIIIGTVQTVDKSRLSGVSIWINGTDIRTVSNPEGVFQLRGVPTVGRVLVMCSLDGFDTAMETVTVNSGETLNLEVTLKLKQLAYEVVVAPKMPKLISASANIGKLSFSPDEIAALPGLGERDIFRSLQLMPGISGSNEASAGLYVRGGTPDKNLILYDGFTVYHVDHFFGVFSAFNPNAIDSVTLFKGGFEARHGGRLSSVMEITGKTGKEKGFNAGVGLSLLSYNGTVEVPLGRNANLLITGRKSFQSPLYQNIFDTYSQDNSSPIGGAGKGAGGGKRGAFYESEPSSYFYDLNAKVTFKPSTRDVMFLSFFNGKDDLDNSRTMGVPPFLEEQGIQMQNDITDITDWGNLAASFTWHRQWNDAVASRAVVGYSDFFNKRENNIDMEITRDGETQSLDRQSLEDNNVKDLSLRLDNTFKLGGNNQLDLGFQITRNSIDYLYFYDDVEDGMGIPGRGGLGDLGDILNRNDNGNIFSAYLQDRFSLFNKITLTPGFRLSYFDVTEKYYYEPRLSMIIDITQRIKLKGAWGKYYQFVNKLTREDNLQGNREFWALADDGLIPIGSSVHYIGGVSYETQNVLIDVETYYKDLKGLTEFSLRFAPVSGEVNYDDYYYQGTGIAKGVELLFQRKFGKYTGWISYTLGKVDYDFPVYSDDPFPASHDVTHEFKMVQSMKHKNWTFASTLIIASGRPYTDPDGIESITLENDRVINVVTYGDKNGQRLPAYMRLDLSASYDFKFKGKTARLGFSIFNVLDRKNVWRKEFEVAEGEIIETDVNYMGFTPNLSFTIFLK
jgi:ferric enterobactin receptor